VNTVPTTPTNAGSYRVHCVGTNGLSLLKEKTLH
jgi:hypothetical protein